MPGSETSDPLAEPALTVDTREELVYLVGQACEIEHGIMCEYRPPGLRMICAPRLTNVYLMNGNS